MMDATLSPWISSLSTDEMAKHAALRSYLSPSSSSIKNGFVILGNFLDFSASYLIHCKLGIKSML